MLKQILDVCENSGVSPPALAAFFDGLLGLVHMLPHDLLQVDTDATTCVLSAKLDTSTICIAHLVGQWGGYSNTVMSASVLFLGSSALVHVSHMYMYMAPHLLLRLVQKCALIATSSTQTRQCLVTYTMLHFCANPHCIVLLCTATFAHRAGNPLTLSSSSRQTWAYLCCIALHCHAQACALLTH